MPRRKKNLARSAALILQDKDMASKKSPHHRPGSHGTPAPAPDGPTPGDTNASPRVILVARALLAVAAILAGYLAWNSLSGGSLPGCGPSSGCDKVLQSRWAYWLGIPVSLPALLVYLGLLVESFSVRSSATPEQRRRAWLMIVGLSVLIMGAALWFVALQVFVLKSFCRFCMTAHASGWIAGFLLLRRAPFASAERAEGKRRDPVAIPVRLGWMLASLAGMALLVLAGGQVLVEKPVSAIRTVRREGVNEMTQRPAPPAGTEIARSSAPTNASAPPPAAGATNRPAEPTPTPTVAAAAPSPAVRELMLHSGKFRLRLGELPMIGSVQASNVVVSLFDYTCHYCRELHGLLVQAQQRFSRELAFLSLPMPLDAACNHIVKRTQSAHQRACEYAALGLAVWRAQPESFHSFDEWMFASPAPPSVGEAKAYADKLVGVAKLEQALTEGWVANQIQTAISLYEANYKQLGEGRMPQLIIGSTISAGPIDRIDELYRLLSEHLGLRAAP